MLSLRDTKKKMIEEITPSLILRLNKLTLNAWNINLSLCKENEEKKKRKKKHTIRKILVLYKNKKNKKKIYYGAFHWAKVPVHKCPTSPPPS